MANFIDFHVLGLFTGDISNSAGVFAGENVQYGWRTSSKSNQTMGRICGDYNRIVGGRQDILDADFLDTYIQKTVTGDGSHPLFNPLQPRSRR